jgi:L-amino acid N-acyltransferase YncA
MDAWSMGKHEAKADEMDALNVPVAGQDLRDQDLRNQDSRDQDLRGVDEFDVEPLHGDDIKRRRKNMLKQRLPHLVAERAGAVIGYAYAVPFRKRPAYRYAIKHSIYVHPDHLHSGVGRSLLPALIEACAAAHYRQIIAYIDAANAPSLHLHESFGFERAGLLKAVGYKYGRWTDSVLMQRAIGDGDTPPPDDIG